MIPGDIDLTEYLDFRKVVRKDIPQLPDNWAKSIEPEFEKFSYINIRNWSDSSYFSYETITDTPNSSLDYFYNNVHTTVWSGTSINYINVSNNIEWNYTNFTNTGISSTKTYNYKITYDESEEYDMFGNKIEMESSIPSIPWKLSIKPNEIPKIDWQRRFERTIRWSKDDDKIPWYIDTEDGEDEYNEYDYYFGEDQNHLKRAKRLICWLSDKSKTFIENYFSENDKKTMSYLTNMGWIRVRDAVVD